MLSGEHALIVDVVTDRSDRLPDDAHVYEIRIRGSLSPQLRAAFAELEPNTETVLRGTLEDRAALHAVLTRIHELGIELVDVRRLDADPVFER